MTLKYDNHVLTHNLQIDTEMRKRHVGNAVPTFLSMILRRQEDQSKYRQTNHLNQLYKVLT